jgi:hypothetical protein
MECVALGAERLGLRVACLDLRAEQPCAGVGQLGRGHAPTGAGGCGSATIVLGHDVYYPTSGAIWGRNAPGIGEVCARVSRDHLERLASRGTVVLVAAGGAVGMHVLGAWRPDDVA